jgi:hypothetical protein
MSISFARKVDSYDDGRKAGDPHSEWQSNYNWYRANIQKDAVQKKIKAMEIKISLDGTNRKTSYSIKLNEKGVKEYYADYTFDVITCIYLSWKKNKINHAFPLNLHTSSDNFERSFNDFFRINQVGYKY